MSGARERRPGLDALLAAVRARQVDVVVIVKLDRLARSTRHLVALVAELEALKVDLVVLDQAIDTTTPAGRLLFHVLAAIAEFERDLIRERVIAGVKRARAIGKHLGRGRRSTTWTAGRWPCAEGRSLRAVARELGVHPMGVRRVLSRASTNPARGCGVSPRQGDPGRRPPGPSLRSTFGRLLETPEGPASYTSYVAGASSCRFVTHHPGAGNEPRVIGRRHPELHQCGPP